MYKKVCPKRIRCLGCFRFLHKLCRIFHLHNLDGGSEDTLIKLTGDIKRGGVVDILEDCAAIQRGLTYLKKQIDRNLVKFSKEKCKVLYLGRNNPVQYCVLWMKGWKVALQKSRGFWWIAH